MCRHIVYIGPRGAGKGMLVSAAMQAFPQIKRIVSHTTRAMRPGEREGDQYHFVPRAEFEAMIDRGEFIRWQKMGATQISGITKAASAAQTFGITDVTAYVAEGMREFAEQRGGRLLRIGVWAPRSERWARAKKRQPQLTNGQVDDLMVSDPNPQEIEAYAGFDHLIINDHSNDPGPAIAEATRAIRDFLNGS